MADFLLTRIRGFLQHFFTDLNGVEICMLRGWTLRQKYQFVRPEIILCSRYKYSLNLKKNRVNTVCAEFGIRWGVLKQFLYRAACYVRTAFSEYLYLLHSIISGLTNWYFWRTLHPMLYSELKIVRKTLIPPVLWLLFTEFCVITMPWHHNYELMSIATS